jgi:hypothetical protein
MLLHTKSAANWRSPLTLSGAGFSSDMDRGFAAKQNTMENLLCNFPTTLLVFFRKPNKGVAS